MTTNEIRIVHKPGLGGWCVYVGSEFVNGAFAHRSEAVKAAERLGESRKTMIEMTPSERQAAIRRTLAKLRAELASPEWKQAVEAALADDEPSS